MKKSAMMTVAIVFIILTTACSFAIAEEKESREAWFRKVVDEMQTWSSHPVIIEALKTANRENTMTMEEILEKDKEWRSSKEITPFIQQFLTNDVAKYLQQIQAEGKGLFAEIEITDVKGVIIAETSKTTDYYQADEAWWQHAYQEGEGNTFRSKPDYDESSHSYNIEVAMPIRDQDNGVIIGIVKTGYSIINLHSVSKD